MKYFLKCLWLGLGEMAACFLALKPSFIAGLYFYAKLIDNKLYSIRRI